MNANPIVRSLVKLFTYYQSLGQKTIDQVSDEGLFDRFNEESNNISVIVKHLHGNMRSRWTDFLNSDGEKEWRDRDGEFEDTFQSRAEIQHAFSEGWTCVLDAISPLTDDDLSRVVYIRNEGHTVLEAIHRQLGHYAYHTGQIVFLGKMSLGDRWNTLSIAKNASKDYNKNKFSVDKKRQHFTDEV